MFKFGAFSALTDYFWIVHKGIVKLNLQHFAFRNGVHETLILPEEALKALEQKAIAKAKAESKAQSGTISIALAQLQPGESANRQNKILPEDLDSDEYRPGTLDEIEKKWSE